MARLILHAHRDGWETALDHPDAVVIDYPGQILRQGTSKYEVKGRKLFAFMAFMLRGADLVHAPAAIAQAVNGKPDYTRQFIQHLRVSATPILAWLGMTLETHYAAGYILHSIPGESLPWLAQGANSQPLPTHVRLPVDAVRASPTTRTRSPRVSRGNAWKHTAPLSASSANSKP